VTYVLCCLFFKYRLFFNFFFFLLQFFNINALFPQSLHLKSLLWLSHLLHIFNFWFLFLKWLREIIPRPHFSVNFVLNRRPSPNAPPPKNPKSKVFQPGTEPSNQRLEKIFGSIEAITKVKSTSINSKAII